MNSPQLKQKLMSAIQLTRSRVVADAPIWFPYPAILSIGLVLMIGSYVFSAINPKYGFSGTLTKLAAEPSDNREIWLAVTIDGDNLFVMTEERQVITLSRELSQNDQIQDLVNYLQSKIDNRIKRLALARRASIADLTVAIAVDQTLRYSHMRPILQALAEVGVTQYGFETIRPGTFDRQKNQQQIEESIETEGHQKEEGS